jgi:serine/threonine protein kinase
MRVCPKCFKLCGPDQDECDRDGSSLRHYTEVLLGLHLGPYIVRSQISEGGMGVVYLAEHPALGRQVAIKVLRPELSLRDDIVERFTQEARAVNTIGHDNIVKIYDFGKTPFGSFYIVMEYLDGITLRSLLDEVGPQPLARVKFIMRQVAAALEAAHNKGFVHRDVKPANIMICRRRGAEFVKLLDFGIAKLVTASGHTTADGLTLGTPRYMSPEQLDDGAADTRTDIYALGVVLYELLTGQVPYPGESQAAVRHAQGKYRPQAPSQCRRDVDVPPRIDRVVFRAINPAPDERFQRVGDLMEALEGLHHSAIERISAAGRVFRSSPRILRNAALIAGSVALIAAAAVIGWYFTHGSTTDPIPADMPPAARDDHPSAESGSTRRPTSSANASDASPRQLVERALQSPDRLRRRAILRQIERVRPEALRAQLLTALQDEDSIVRRLAAQTLGSLKHRDPATIAALRAALPRQLGFAAVAFARSLLQLGEDDALVRLRRELVLAKRRGPQAERFALEALAERDPAAARRLASYARATGWADSPAVKARLLQTMSRAGLAAAQRELYRAATKQPEAEARLEAAVALRALEDPRAQKLLERLRQAPSSSVQARAISALLQPGDIELATFLLELCRSTEDQARVHAALGVGRAQSAELLPKGVRRRAKQVLSTALNDANEQVRSAAAVALLAFE